MTLIVETGAGLPDSESYISVADADTYFAARNNAAWAAIADIPTKEGLLRDATDYMRQTYRLSWIGMRVTILQALDWPRAWVPIPDSPGGYHGFPTYLPLDVVPKEVKDACASLALRALAGPLTADIGPQVTREQVGPIAVDYLPGGRQDIEYPEVDRMLAVWLKGRGAMNVVRA